MSKLTLQHGSRKLTGVGTITLQITRKTLSYVHLPDVLSSDLNLLSQKVLSQREVQGSRSDHDIAIGLKISSSIESIDKLSQRRHSSVLDVTISLSLLTHFQFPPIKSLRGIISRFQNMYEGLSCTVTSFDFMIIKSGSHYTCKCRLAKTDNI